VKETADNNDVENESDKESVDSEVQAQIEKAQQEYVQALTVYKQLFQ